MHTDYSYMQQGAFGRVHRRYRPGYCESRSAFDRLIEHPVGRRALEDYTAALRR